jgi:hypothetical protein
LTVVAETALANLVAFRTQCLTPGLEQECDFLSTGVRGPRKRIAPPVQADPMSVDAYFASESGISTTWSFEPSAAERS